MAQTITAIFFDTGNTLRVVEKDAVFQKNALEQLMQLIGAREDPEAFGRLLEERYQTYKKMAKATQFQTSEGEVWTRWMLPEHPAGEVAALANRLTLLWHACSGRRLPRPDAIPTLIELHQRGYILGIIANAISTTEIPDWLEADGLTPLFKAVILSSRVRWRKPDPHIYEEAARVAGVKPASCAYVGDNPDRDIQGARQAGFSKVFLLREAASPHQELIMGRNRPDGILCSCRDLLQFCPARTNLGKGSV